MKSISFKKFRKSGERLTRAQYEKNCGNEVSSPEVYAYVNFLHIEIHKNKESNNEEFYLVVVGNEDLETHSLLEAETFLYENMKSELPKKEKEEKVCKKAFPNGVNSWIAAHYEISSSMGFYLGGGEKESEVLVLLNSDDEREEFAFALATEFETAFNGIDFHEKMSTFIMCKLFPKKTFTVRATVSTECTIEIVAENEVEACQLAENACVGDFEEDATTTRVVVH
jgi:hypothetical protein